MASAALERLIRQLEDDMIVTQTNINCKKTIPSLEMAKRMQRQMRDLALLVRNLHDR